MSSQSQPKSSAELSDEQLQKLLELANDSPIDRNWIVYAAGFLLGMATGTRHNLDDYDREVLARASCYLKKSVIGES